MTGLAVPRHAQIGREFARALVTKPQPQLDAGQPFADPVFWNILLRQNLFFSFVFNGLGVPIAAGVLYPVARILLSPMIAGAAMALSSFTVVTNAVRLNAAKL